MVASDTASQAMLTLPQTVRLGNAEQVLSLLTQGLKGSSAQTKLQLDASALQNFDSAALAVVLECQRRALASGRSVTLVGAPLKLEELARVYGLTGLLWPVKPQAAGA